jgi:hypothetical protein
MVTCEHENSASSSIRLQSIDGDEEPGAPGKCGPDISRLTVLEDPGAGAASPRTALLEMLAPMSCTTKSCNKPLVLSPSRQPASAASMLVAPCRALLAPGNSIADSTTSR